MPHIFRRPKTAIFWYLSIDQSYFFGLVEIDVYDIYWWWWGFLGLCATSTKANRCFLFTLWVQCQGDQGKKYDGNTINWVSILGIKHTNCFKNTPVSKRSKGTIKRRLDPELTLTKPRAHRPVSLSIVGWLQFSRKRVAVCTTAGHIRPIISPISMVDAHCSVWWMCKIMHGIALLMLKDL